MESEILQRLHDSEINGKIEWFFDGEWTATLGDEYVGCLEVIETSDFAEAVNELAMAAVKFYPGSEFAKWWIKQIEYKKSLEEIKGKVSEANQYWQTVMEEREKRKEAYEKFIYPDEQNKEVK